MRICRQKRKSGPQRRPRVLDIDRRPRPGSRWFADAALVAALIAALIATQSDLNAADLETPGTPTVQETAATAEALASPAGSPIEEASPRVEEAPPRTLAEYLAEAALHNPGLRAAFERWKADLEMVPQVRAYPDPRFNFTYMIREVETRVGPQQMKFGLSQTFPWFGKLGLRGDVAFESSEASRRRYEAEKLRLFYDVKETFHDYDYLHRAIDITRRNVDLLSDLERVARIRYRTAAAGHPDVIKAQVELGKLEDRLAALEDARAPLVARLNALLNRPPDDPLPWPESPPARTLIPSDTAILARAAEMNPDLLALSHEVRRREKQLALAGKESYPDVTLGVDYIVTGDALDPNTPDSGKDPWMATLSVNLPIWRGRVRAAEREAEARLRSVTLLRDSRENELESRVKRVLFDCRDAERKQSLYRDTLIPKGRQSLEATQTAFMAGQSDFLDVIDAQRALLEFELSFDRSLANHGQRLAELEMLVGETLPVEEVER